MLACQCTAPIITGAIDAVHPSFDMQARASSAARPGHLRAAALAALPPAAAARVAWTDARFPTIRDPAVLRGLVHSLGLSRTRLLSDDSAPTLLERSSGNWEDVIAGLGAGSGGDVLSMAAAFHAHVAPSAAAPSTRSKDWAGWRAVLSWATARRSLGKILPMSRTTLEALIWEMLACQCTSPIINGVIDAVQARHRCFALASPIAGPRAFLPAPAEPGPVPGHPVAVQIPNHSRPRHGHASPSDVHARAGAQRPRRVRGHSGRAAALGRRRPAGLRPPVRVRPPSRPAVPRHRRFLPS